MGNEPLLPDWLRATGRYIRSTFNLTSAASVDDIVELTMSEAEMRGHRAWILASAIFVASLGLNANSTAVVIGAMLISPLMGPVVGIGVAIRLWDQHLLRRSIRSLFISIVVSIVVSTAFFLLSPFIPSGSELAARTTPTLLDGLIAVFGGVAGAVSLLRKDRGNVIPGVAIATALMPPLCTVGYGIATWQPAVFAGAFYLFFINGVGISAATYLVLRIAKIDAVERRDGQSKRFHRIMIAFVIATLLPAAVISWNMIQDGILQRRVDRFAASLQDHLRSASVLITRTELDSDEPSIDIAVIGTNVDTAVTKMVDSLRITAGLTDIAVNLHSSLATERSTTDASDVVRLYRSGEIQRARFTATIDSLNSIVDSQRLRDSAASEVATELRFVFPQISEVLIATNTVMSSADTTIHTAPMVYVSWTRSTSASTNRRLHAWLKLRLRDSTVQLRTMVKHTR